MSDYPNQYETKAITKGGLDIFIRPIKPEDAPKILELFDSLSPRSIYFRFLSPLKRISPEMLARLTQIDYDREMALIALDKTEQGRILGVVRVITFADGKRAEYAIVVSDPWQGKGVGACLLKKCATIASERGIESLWGLVAPENVVMLHMARQSGGSIKRCSFEESCYEVTLYPRKFVNETEDAETPSQASNG